MTGYKHHLGPVESELLRRGRGSSAKLVYVGNYREMRAARKLAKRGLLEQLGMLPVFSLTEKLRGES